MQLLGRLPTGPSSAGTEELPQWWGHTEKSQRGLCSQERKVGAAQRGGLSSPVPVPSQH